MSTVLVRSNVQSNLFPALRNACDSLTIKDKHSWNVYWNIISMLSLIIIKKINQFQVLKTTKKSSLFFSASISTPHFYACMPWVNNKTKLQLEQNLKNRALLDYTTQHNTTQNNIKHIKHNATQHSQTQHNITKHNTSKHNTVQCNRAKQNTTQQNVQKTTKHETTWKPSA